MLEKAMENVRKETPLVHNITNYVTVNDVANAILACGASPIMSDEPQDVSDITSICGGLNINIGTLNERSIEAMFVAGKRAKELDHIVLLDPVGAGASKLRTDTATRIMNEIKPDIIRGNISEIKTLALGSGTTKGVDADIADSVTEGNLSDMISFAKAFSKRTNAVIAITGAIDLVADSDKCYVIRNGVLEMSRITGTGCQLSGIATAYAVANKDDITNAVAAAVCVMGLAGEIGFANLKENEGNSTLRNRIIDAICNMDEESLTKGAKYELR
ncbi:MAG: hydroxyethylthiazole kinase [Ruminococcaceae bacterium]|nr:hydroxyethylthiazole kinase [Oscillospiraceae bacterium]